LAISSRQKTVKKSAKRKPEKAPNRRSLILAELSYQRGEIGKTMQLLKRMRSDSVTPGFKEENLYGCSLGLGLEIKKSTRVFEKLSRKFRKSGLYYEKARFNLGLVHLYRDLLEYGDQTVTKQAMTGQVLIGQDSPPMVNYQKAFQDSIDVWSELLPKTKHYRNIVLAFLAYAFLLRGDLQKALDAIQESLSLSKSFYISYYVAAKIFLDFYFLTDDGISFTLPPESFQFFNCNKDDVLKEEEDRLRVFSDVYIRTAQDLLAEALKKNPNAPELYISMIICTYCFGQDEELQRYLNDAEAMIPESKVLLDTVYWLVRESSGSPGDIKVLLNRLKEVGEGSSNSHVFHLIAPYYLI